VHLTAFILRIWTFLAEVKKLSVTTASSAVLHPSYSPLCAIIIHLMQGSDFETIYYAVFSCVLPYVQIVRVINLYIFQTHTKQK